MLDLPILKKAQVLCADGSTVIVEPEGPKGTFTLKQLQDACGGYIETIPVNDPEWQDYLLIGDDEAHLKAKPINDRASKLYGVGLVAGDVMLCRRNQID